MNKTLLAIGAGAEACHGLKIAKDMGLTLIAVDGNPEAPGFALADYTLTISTYAGEQIADAAEQLVNAGAPIDGVMAMCADVPLSVATIADRLHLPGLSKQSATWVADKLLMKQRLEKMNIPIPSYRPVSTTQDMHQAAAQFGLPFIIKPVDSRGARGVQLIEHENFFETSLHLAQGESPTRRAMVEEYLVGPQISTETLICNKCCYTLGFADRNYEWLSTTKPFMIENGGDSPSNLPPEDQRAIKQTAENAALALGIDSGVAKGDMVMTAEGPKVIEIAGRLSGGYFSTIQIPLATGVNFVKHAIRLSLGMHLTQENVTPTQAQAVAIRYLVAPAGIVKSITGIDEARNAPGVNMLSIDIAPGKHIQPLKNHTERLGFVITTGNDKSQAVQRAYSALNKIEIAYTEDHRS